jgi:hypothetical protein
VITRLVTTERNEEMGLFGPSREERAEELDATGSTAYEKAQKALDAGDEDAYYSLLGDSARASEGARLTRACGNASGRSWSW